MKLSDVNERAAELLLQYAEQIASGCGDGAFDCADCPVGVKVCKAEHAELVEVASQLRRKRERRGR